MTVPASELWNPAPRRTPRTGLPESVRVFEVGPRDGLQAESRIVSVEVKRELCERLLRAGVSLLEVTSFVPQRWIPQLADAEALTQSLTLPETARGFALAPNLTGLDRAERSGFTRLSIVASATESFARANLNGGREETMVRAEALGAECARRGFEARGYLSMSFGDPWEGHVEPDRVAELASRLFAAGCTTVALSDTIGTAGPGHVHEVVEATLARGVPSESIALHLHDTYGTALANAYAGLEAGVREFDASVGGLGRCPFAPGAAGNLATEDLVWMLDGIGIESGIDLGALVGTSIWMEQWTGHPSPSRTVRAHAARRKPLATPAHSRP